MIDIIPATIQCNTSEVVIMVFLSLSRALTRCAMNGFRMKPWRTISSTAVTLVNKTQIPISLLGIILTMKNMLRKPKRSTETLFSNENAPSENQREYAIDANGWRFII
jgi:hypothetical protein